MSQQCGRQKTLCRGSRALQSHSPTPEPTAVKYPWPVATILLLCLSSAAADETRLSSDEIDALLKGNTINGVHYGKKTIQYFSASGLTLWIGEGDQTPTEGQWKTQDNQYCSKFGKDWGCLDIVLDEAQNVYYFIGTDFRAPFVPAAQFSLQF